VATSSLVLAVLAAAPAVDALDTDLHVLTNELLELEISDEHLDSYPFADCFRAAAARYQIPAAVLLAVAKGESDFDADAVSRRDGREIAHGVMQIKWPETATDLGFGAKDELYRPCPNIDAGARYLRWMLDRYDGDLYYALAAYNYGPGRITAGRTLPTGAHWYVEYIGDKAARLHGRGYIERRPLRFYHYDSYYYARRTRSLLERRVERPGVEFDVQKDGEGGWDVLVRFADWGDRGATLAAIREHTGLEPMRDE
jgi:hypothetical protein